eukprot:6511878-Heterocapsa_arctica.AAC.1
MLPSDFGKFSSCCNFPHQCFRQGESAIIELGRPLYDFAFPNSHPYFVDIGENGNWSELPLILCPFFRNEGDDWVKPMLPSLVFSTLLSISVRPFICILESALSSAGLHPSTPFALPSA